MERIAELIIKHLSSEISPAEEIELQEWINERPERQEFFNDPEKLRDKLNWKIESQARILAELKRELFPKSEVVAMKRGNFRRYLYVAAAVFFLAILGVTGYFLLNKKPAENQVVKKGEYQDDVLPPVGSQARLILSGGESINLDDVKNGLVTNQGNVQVSKEGDAIVYKVISTDTEVLFHTLQTGSGGFTKVNLPDGSSVWLNALTSLTYPTRFVGSTRKVKVDGEAFFEVAKNKKMPFIVDAHDMSIEVTGTSFAISAYADDAAIRTTLVEGSVKVVKGNKVQNLVAGQQADVAGSDVRIVEEGNYDEAIAFRDNRFAFQETSIENIMKQVKRWYGVEVEYQGKIDRYFSAPLSRNEPLSRLLKLLELTERVHFRIEGNKVIVLP